VLALATPLVAVATVLRPIVGALNGVANGAIRLIGVTPRSEATSVFTLDQVATIVAESTKEGVLEDALFLLVRGLQGPWLAPGTKRAVPFLASPFWRRLAHQRFGWAMATVERLVEPATVRVPAGTFSCDVYVVRTPDGRSGRFEVERAHPRRNLAHGMARGCAVSGVCVSVFAVADHDTRHRRLPECARRIHAR